MHISTITLSPNRKQTAMENIVKKSRKRGVPTSTKPFSQTSPPKKTKKDKPSQRKSAKTSKDFFAKKSTVSQTKHDILSNYLAAWLPMLCNNRYRIKHPYSQLSPQYSRVVYVDGFAGPGLYSNGERGSPMVAYQMALEHKSLKDDCPDIILIFVEKNKNFSNDLLQNLLELKRKNKEAKNASKVTFMVINRKFVDAMKWIISDHFTFEKYSEEFVHPIVSENITTTKTKKFIDQFTPLLVFVDPFGYKGEQMPMTLMRNIMQTTTKSAMLINLMTGFLQRRIKLDSSAKQLNLLIGGDEWNHDVLKANETKTKENISRILKVYTFNLSEGQSGQVFTCIFEMRNEKNGLLYHLFSAEHHIKAFQTIKNSMRKASQKETMFQFSAFQAKKSDFEKTLVSIPELTNKIITHFKGRVVSGADITKFLEYDEVLTQRYRNPLKKTLKEYCKEKNRKFDKMQFEFRCDK